MKLAHFIRAGHNFLFVTKNVFVKTISLSRKNNILKYTTCSREMDQMLILLQAILPLTCFHYMCEFSTIYTKKFSTSNFLPKNTKIKNLINTILFLKILRLMCTKYLKVLLFSFSKKYFIQIFMKKYPNSCEFILPIKKYNSSKMTY